MDTSSQKNQMMFYAQRPGMEIVDLLESLDLHNTTFAGLQQKPGPHSHHPAALFSGGASPLPSTSSSSSSRLSVQFFHCRFLTLCTFVASWLFLSPSSSIPWSVLVKCNFSRCREIRVLQCTCERQGGVPYPVFPRVCLHYLNQVVSLFLLGFT